MLTFTFKEEPTCDSCGDLEPWVPISQESIEGRLCPWCAYAYYAIDAKRLDELLDTMLPLEKFYKFKKEYPSVAQL